MPAFFLLLALGLARLSAWAAARLETRAPWVLVVAQGLTAALALLCVVAANSFTRDARQQWLLRQPPLHQMDNAHNVRTARRLQEVTTDQALIALSWAGAIPYFSHRPSHDLLGKCDRSIAHEPAHVITGWNVMDSFVPGHLKWDFDYSILQLQPDLVLRDISRGPRQKAAFLQRYRSFYLGEQLVYARLGSPRIKWEVLRRLDAAEKQRQLKAWGRSAGGRPLGLSGAGQR